MCKISRLFSFKYQISLPDLPVDDNQFYMNYPSIDDFKLATSSVLNLYLLYSWVLVCIAIYNYFHLF